MTKKKTHETLLGEVIEYPVQPANVAAFIARATSAAYDPLVSEADLTALLYGPENPVLEHGRFEGRGAVTPAELRNPVYAVFLDLLDVKRAATGKASKPALEAAFRDTVSETAERLGISSSAIRQAIERGNIAAVKRPNGWLVDPKSADLYAETSKRRGPPRTQPALKLAFGNAPGVSFRPKVKDLEITDRGTLKDGKITFGEVASFKRVAIAISGKDMHRVLVLEPAARPTRYEHGPFWVEGRFKFAGKSNDAQKSSQFFRDFEAE